MFVSIVFIRFRTVLFSTSNTGPASFGTGDSAGGCIEEDIPSTSLDSKILEAEVIPADSGCGTGLLSCGVWLSIFAISAALSS